MQRQRRIPFASRVAVAIRDRRGAEHRRRGIEDRRQTIGRVRVAFRYGARRSGYSGD
jgi:hypothetical protein